MEGSNKNYGFDTIWLKMEIPFNEINKLQFESFEGCNYLNSDSKTISKKNYEVYFKNKRLNSKANYKNKHLKTFLYFSPIIERRIGWKESVEIKSFIFFQFSSKINKDNKLIYDFSNLIEKLNTTLEEILYNKKYNILDFKLSRYDISKDVKIDYDFSEVENFFDYHYLAYKRKNINYKKSKKIETALRGGKSSSFIVYDKYEESKIESKKNYIRLELQNKKKLNFSENLNLFYFRDLVDKKNLIIQEYKSFLRKNYEDNYYLLYKPKDNFHSLKRSIKDKRKLRGINNLSSVLKGKFKCFNSISKKEKSQKRSYIKKKIKDYIKFFEIDKELKYKLDSLFL
ncbi:hypothetical protein [Oceanotoga teriensis]|uniref:hypothetical protein n=1 Tax=Oceanotoga teriensis TaxID=515440 RepID=UPI002713727A|nr:hypothetical protein [Oceanotoga teriensis]MDO7976737.1 hypothetical protein [Oceanotoga teriensis]